MAKWASNDVLDGGGNHLRTLAGTANRVKMHLLKDYADGDTHAAVILNSLGSISMAAADLPASTNGTSRRTAVATKTIALTANSGASPDLHVALVDSTASAVLLVTDETSNQIVTSGGTFSIPEWIYTVNQPA